MAHCTPGKNESGACIHARSLHSRACRAVYGSHHCAEHSLYVEEVVIAKTPAQSTRFCCCVELRKETRRAVAASRSRHGVMRSCIAEHLSKARAVGAKWRVWPQGQVLCRRPLVIDQKTCSAPDHTKMELVTLLAQRYKAVYGTVK